MACLVMGIVNVTPDSFSDGGKFFSPAAAVRRVRRLFRDGADIVDIGAESTRPGAAPLDWREEWSRLEPVLRGLSPHKPRGLSPRISPHISIDTYHPETARLALEAGAEMINCVYGETAGEIVEICRKYRAEVVIPAKSAWLLRGLSPQDAGTVPAFIDPMVGFGTTREEDLELLRSVPELAKKWRVLVGVSRKRIVRKLACGDGNAAIGCSVSRGGNPGSVGSVSRKILGVNIGLAVWSALNGASAVRVHDVAETVQALAAVSALQSPGGLPMHGSGSI